MTSKYKQCKWHQTRNWIEKDGVPCERSSSHFCPADYLQVIIIQDVVIWKERLKIRITNRIINFFFRWDEILSRRQDGSRAVMVLRQTNKPHPPVRMVLMIYFFYDFFGGRPVNHIHHFFYFLDTMDVFIIDFMYFVGIVTSTFNM